MDARLLLYTWKKPSHDPIIGPNGQIKKSWPIQKKIVFEDKDTKHDRFCEIILETFPQLGDCGGFTLHRAKTGGQNRPLFQLDITWYHVKNIRKEVSSSACIYLKPLQQDIDLNPNKVRFLFMLRKTDAGKNGGIHVIF